ncbi:hypothetical protein [Sphingomonas jaspsi]|uniref:hypothetical protein n=1 Tax=Sphingomonas jaspsi TaxID=392409 RepID=UPI0004B8B4BD|nr:hypothetical protein [Sphingomonas jaspsi]
MINPFLACELKRAERTFSKQGQPNLAYITHRARGDMADSMNPDETEAHRLVRLAFGDQIDA